MGRDAQAVSRLHLAAPLRGVRGRLDHAAQTAGLVGIAGRVFAIDPVVGHAGGVDLARRPDQLQQIIFRIAPGRRRKLRNEALDREGVRDVGDRAEPADPRMRFRLRVLDPQVRDREGHIDRAHAELERRLVLRIGSEDRGDARRHRAVQPSYRLAVRVEPRLQPLHRHRVEEAVVQVVLAREGHLHRTPVHGLRQDRRLAHKVGLRLAAEAAAQERVVDGHLLERDPEALREVALGRLRRLRAAPHLDGIRRHARGAARGLHRRLRQMRDVVLRLDALCRCLHRCIDVAVVAHDFARGARMGFQCLAILGRRVAAVGAVVPGDLQLGAPLDGGESVLRHHRDAAHRLERRRDRGRVDRHHLEHTRNLERLRRIVARDLAAIDRRPCDHREGEPLRPRIDAVLRVPSGDIEAVDELNIVMADEAEFRGILELERRTLGHRTRRGAPRQRAKAEAAAGRGVHDLIVLRRQLRGRDLPAVGGLGFQHLPRGGADAAQRREMLAHAARAVGVLAAVAVLVAERLLDLHARPVGLELVGDDHGEAGAHALTHLGAIAQQRHRAVIGDGEEDARIVLEPARHGIAAIFLGGLRMQRGRQSGREHERAGGEPEQHGAPADIGGLRESGWQDRVHGQTLPAARLIASRMRG